MQLFILVSLLFTNTFAQNGEGGGGEGDTSCFRSESIDECVDGLNGTCVWMVYTEEDCGECTDLDSDLTCEDAISGTYDDSTELYCESDGEGDVDMCEVIDTGTDGEGEGDDNEYNCTDSWEDDDNCEEYSTWTGTIVASTSLFNFRWLCFVCDWDNTFTILFPGARVSVSIEADCYSSSDTNGEDGDGESSEGTVGEGGNDQEDGGNERRRLLQGGNEGEDDDSEGEGDVNNDGEYDNTDGTTVEISVDIEAEFLGCNAFAAIADEFTDLATRVQDEIEDITVIVSCDKLDCCIEDDYCQSHAYCDTDSDGVYDTYDTDGDGENDDTNVSVNGENDANQVTSGLFVLSMLAFAAIVLN